jgi:hypothetical protein
VLFRREELDLLQAGGVVPTYRRWQGPRAKAGATQRTQVGVVRFEAVTKVTAASISAADARAAGWKSRKVLLAKLAGRPGRIYRIDVAWAGEDPRVELRNRIAKGDDLAQLTARLDQIDARSPRGPWTAAMLQLLAANEGVRAEDLAAGQGREKKPFKLDVRKLKELGLTESLLVGYRVSPRGRAFLAGRAKPGRG